MHDRLSAALAAKKILLTGVGLAVVYWFVEAIVLDALIFGEGTVASELLPLGRLHEFWHRLVAVAMFIASGAVAQYLLDKSRRARERNSQLAAIVESSGEAIIGCAPDGTVRSWNPAAERLFGYAAGEVVGGPVSVLVPADRRAELSGVFEEASRGRGTGVEETTWLRKGGEKVWVSVSLSPIRDLRGGVVGVSTTARDVTEQRRTREELRRQKDLYETLLNAQSELGVGFLIVEGQRIVYANDAYCEITGYGEEELRSMPSLVEALVPEEERPALRERMSRRAGGEDVSEHYETAIVARDGRRVDVEVGLKTLPWEGGTRIVATVRDITDRRRSQDELKARALQQAAVAQLGQRALGETDLQALMDEAVVLAARTLGADFCEVLELQAEGDALILRSGAGWDEGIVGYATLGSDLDSQVGYTLLLKEPVVVEDLREDERFDGPGLFIEHGVVSGASVVIQGRERPFGVLGAHTGERRTFGDDDVNFLRAVANVLGVAIERGRAEEALLEAQEGERRRIARDLHDLVLQDLTDALQALQETQLRSENLGQGVDLEREIGTLRRTVEGLRGAIYDLRQVEGWSFVRELRSLVEHERRMAPGRGLDLEVEEGFPQELPGRVATEVLRIVQEALTNARRHSGSRRVRVALRADRDEASVEVADDGRGFDPATVPGGVGLAGMRERALALGGSLEVESAPGEGARVHFRAPLTALLEAGSPPAPVPSAANQTARGKEERKRLLLVEDHVSFRQSLAFALSSRPEFELVAQVGSLAGAREVLAGLEGELDVAIVDLALPDGTGTDLIEDLHGASPRAAVLVLTASLDRQQYAWAVEAGAAGVLHKSASVDSIVRALRRLLAGESLLPPGEVVELLRLAIRQRKRDEEARSRLGLLTRREQEVLGLLAEGLDGKEIARRLEITPKTEHSHMMSIFNKLGVHSRLQALVFAVRHGLVDIPRSPSALEPPQRQT